MPDQCGRLFYSICLERGEKKLRCSFFIHLLVYFSLNSPFPLLFLIDVVGEVLGV